MNHYSREYALQLDRADSIKDYRSEFYIKEGQIYMDGNSLGLLSKRAESSVLDLLDSWKNNGIDGWTNGTYPWFYLSEQLGEKLAPLIGAKHEEVILTGSTTTNLHQLLATFYQPKGNRTKIMADELNFPSDIYAIKSQLTLKGYDPTHHLVSIKSRDGHMLLEDDIIDRMSNEIAVIILPSILYRSGQILDMKRLTEEAHKRNILIGFDLCHSIGSISHHLGEWDVDFAFWCTYKHLNGGPGAVGGLYVNNRHFGVMPGLSGWFSSSKEKQFDMEHDLTAASDAGALQIGTPHILSAAPLIGSLSMFEEIGIEAIRSKSLKLTDYMMNLIDQELLGYHFVLRSPRKSEIRGGHLFIEHPEAARICQALKANGVIPDFRSPNGIRLAPVALYNTFEDVWQTVQILKRIMVEKLYLQYENKRGVVA